MMHAISKTIHSAHLYYLFIFVFFLFTISFFVQATSFSGTPCHTVTKIGETPSSYGVPINLFSGFLEPLITVTCDGNDASRIEIGSGESTQLIYMYGYRKVDGKWLKTTFSGDNSSGPWLIGKAEATVEGIRRGETGTVLAYICQNVQNEWKCGCSDKACLEKKWQLQEYSVSSGATDSQDVDSTADGELDVHYPTKYLGLPGETITLIGSGFKKGPVNTVTWNGKIGESGVSSLSGSSLGITVPDLPPGKYEIRVKQGDSISKFGISIWIATGENLPKPVIDSISPESGLQGGTFTIHGEGFTKVNDVITTFGVLKDLPSKDGKTITIHAYDPFDEKLATYTEDAVQYEYALPVNVTVMNTSGQSNMKIFNVNI